MEFAIKILYTGLKIVQDKQAQSILWIQHWIHINIFIIYYHRYNINQDKLKFGILVTIVILFSFSRLMIKKVFITAGKRVFWVPSNIVVDVIQLQFLIMTSSWLISKSNDSVKGPHQYGRWVPEFKIICGTYHFIGLSFGYDILNHWHDEHTKCLKNKTHSVMCLSDIRSLHAYDIVSQEKIKWKNMNPLEVYIISI